MDMCVLVHCANVSHNIQEVCDLFAPNETRDPRQRAQ